VLLKEIHHRVKNNMQVISSLVSLQTDLMEDAATREILREISHRVRSMAMVHEKLYQAADLAIMEFADYTRSLLNYLWHAHAPQLPGVELVTDLEPVPLTVNAAVPCGLILHELVSNALKHAFKGRDSGRVTVSLRSGIQDRISLEVRDNGIGLPPELD
jgi:two-component sensor histidine kinase